MGLLSLSAGLIQARTLPADEVTCAYRLVVTLRDGFTQEVFIDQKSYLVTAERPDGDAPMGSDQAKFHQNAVI